ncbi:sulfatase [Planctomycetota bacterium]
MKRMTNHYPYLFFGIVSLLVSVACADKMKPNVLLIVADDLSYDSLGFAGGVAPNVTPNIDRLHQDGMSFTKAFNTVSVCQPSRQSMLTGLLPHNYGSFGFFPIKKKVPTLPSMLAKAGYVTANIHKLHHMLPVELFGWHYTNKSLGLLDADGVVGKDPQAFARGLTKVIKAAEDGGVPFFVVANSADPHRPFHGDPVMPSTFFGRKKVVLKEPSRVYSAQEVTVPPELPDLPGLREDLARYASSVRRLDDTVGACLTLLENTGKLDSTIVLFVSDNGMPLPFAKFDTYFSSNRTPFLLRLPDRTTAGRVDESHLVSLMDVTPTILELVGIPVPGGLDGRSLLPIIEGKDVSDWRDGIVFLRYDDIYYGEGIEHRLRFDPDFTSTLQQWGWQLRPDHPETGTYSRERQQRCYFDGRFGYIYNDWYRPDGLESCPLGAGVPYPDRSYNSMKRVASKNETVSQRVQQYLLRASEELYDWTKDPGSQVNLVEDPEFAAYLKQSRKKLKSWMKVNNDSLLKNYQTKVYKPAGQ